MAKVFATYSHRDREAVHGIMRRVEEDGHQIELDERFLLAGMVIRTEIQKKVRDAEFVLVFLSPHAVLSNWVSQEMYEVLSEELKSRVLRLIPCLLSDCTRPEAFDRLRRYERVFIDFRENNVEDGTRELLERLKLGKCPVFEGENSLVLNISVPDLEIYMTGEDYGWQKNIQCRYVETLDSYLLFGFLKSPGSFFKHFVICDETDAPRIRDQLTNAGYLVTGVGKKDLETGRRWIWFAITGLKGMLYDAPSTNNKWPG